MSDCATFNYVCPAPMDEDLKHLKVQTRDKTTKKACTEKAVAQGWKPWEYQYIRGKQRRRGIKRNRQKDG